MEKILESRRARVAAAWNLSNEIVLIAAGEELAIPGRGDQIYPFRAHSEHYFLTDYERPGSILAFDPQDGWTDFVPEVTQEHRVWTGDVPNIGTPRSQLDDWLEARGGRPIAVLGCALPDVVSDDELSKEVRVQLSAVRRPKDAHELARMRRAACISQAGFEVARNLIRPGISERQLQIELETAFFRAGAEATAYDSIVGFGSNAAVFHFSPSDRVLRPGELVLIDAGAQYRNYASDVTRTFAADGAFSPEQRDIYAIVLAAEKAAIERCRAGKEYKEIHLEAAVDLARGLVDFGILRGDPETLVEQDVHALFFPHGVGHLLGLGVRDVHYRMPGREPSTRPGLKNLRIDMPLEAGFVVTIEPGLYFVPALLTDEANRERYRQEVHWQRVDGMLDFGGVRIEDNLLITDGDPENLTAGIPKELP